MESDSVLEEQARILVVEDEQIVALDLRIHLEKFGYIVIAVYAEAEAALSYLSETQDSLPDLVVMDIHLQGEMDGIEAASVIKDRYTLPVIFMTAYADEETLSRAKISEPFAYIIKPFEERELRTAVVLAMYRHRMNRMLLAREALLSQVMERMNSGIVVTNGEGTIQYANSLALGITGRELIAGTSIRDAIPTPILDELKLSREDFFDTGETAFRSTWWNRTSRSGDSETIEVSVDPRHEDANSVLWMLTDLTERLKRERSIREQETQLAHSRRMEAIGRLSAAMAHDFNNLLTVIMGHARLALDEISEHPELNELTENVRGMYDTARRSAGLTRQLLSFSRVPETEQEDFVFDDLIAEMEPMLKSALPEDVRIEIANRAGDACVRAERRAMQQVVLNLVFNARDAMPQGGIVYLTTERLQLSSPLATFNRTLAPGEYVLITVRDTGEGIHSDDLPHVFEPFFSTKDEQTGSGFGLSTVYTVVSDVDGAVQVKSTLGHGARFSIYLPVSAAAGGSREETYSEEETLRGTGTILVVEEEDGVREMLVQALRSNGYTPISARSVGEGVLMLGAFRECSLTVSDLSAPYHTTSEIIDLYRNAREGVKVILTFAGEPVESLQDGTLLKPFEPRALLELLREILP